MLDSDPAPLSNLEYTSHGLFMRELGFNSYDKASANAGTGWLNLRTVDFSKYDLILVDSDGGLGTGGALRSEDVGVLNSRAADLIQFINGGGALVADSEAHVTTASFGYVAFGLTQTASIYSHMYDHVT